MRALFKNQSNRENILLSSTHFTLMRTDFLGSHFKNAPLHSHGKENKQTKPPKTEHPHTLQGSPLCNHTTHPPNLCSLLAWHGWVLHLKSIYMQLLHTFIGGNVLFEYVFQAQIQNQMQKEGVNFPNFAI